MGIFSWIRNAVRQAVVAGFRDGIEGVGGVVNAAENEQGNVPFLMLVNPPKQLEAVPHSLSNGQRTRKGVIK